MSCIELGKGVILKKGKNLKYIFTTESKQEKMENFFFSCVDMIGKPFGTAFKVIDKKKLDIIDPVLLQDHSEEYENKDDTQFEETKDNRSIQDNPSSQKLSKDDIMSLRDEGKSGEEIVQELIENSATFKDRTEYSKAKYLKKKKKKYIAQFVVLKPTARLLAEMYFFKNPGKILELRPDSLAQILTWGNIQAGSNVLLMETCQGFVAGAVLERLGSDGTLVQLYHGSFPVRIIMEQFNFSTESVRQLLCSFPMEKIASLPDMFHSGKSNEELIEYIFGKSKPEANEQIEVESKIKELDDKEEMDITVNSERVDVSEAGGAAATDINKAGDENQVNKETRNSTRKRKHTEDDKKEINPNTNTKRVAFISKEERVSECLQAMTYLRKRNLDSLVIVSKYHPKKILLALLEYLPRACPFVVYFTHQEPLMECYVTLRDMNIAINMELTESWLRNIQVLPKRTHPEIVMSGSGGYLLRGIKIDAS